MGKTRCWSRKIFFRKGLRPKILKKTSRQLINFVMNFTREKIFCSNQNIFFSQKCAVQKFWKKMLIIFLSFALSTYFFTSTYCFFTKILYEIKSIISITYSWYWKNVLFLKKILYFKIFLTFMNRVPQKCYFKGRLLFYLKILNRCRNATGL